jgi:hypothetical protein
MSKAVKKIKKAVKKVGKKIEKGIKTGAKSIERSVSAASKGDLKEIINIGSFGMTGAFEKGHKELLRPIKKLTPKMPEIPDIPTAEDIAGKIDIPEPLSQGATQASIGQAAPSIDLGATEGKRRRAGSALGRRKLRVPLGGLA